MNEEENKRINLNILKYLEDISSELNRAMSDHTKSAFEKYPLTFALLILFGVIAVHEGVKGVLQELGILELNPWYILIAGLCILTITGTLYKKLDK